MSPRSRRAETWTGRVSLRGLDEATWTALKHAAVDAGLGESEMVGRILAEWLTAKGYLKHNADGMDQARS